MSLDVAARSITEASSSHERFEATVWRVHWREVEATDWSLSLRSLGRYHRGTDLFPANQAWPALYTSMAAEVAIWEMVRRSMARNIDYLKNNVLSEIRLTLENVLDLTLPFDDGRGDSRLTGPNIHLCQEIAALARDRHYQGLVVPSAAIDNGKNLVHLPDNLSSRTSIEVIRTSVLNIDF